MIVEFVGPNQPKLPRETVERFREAAVAAPRTAEPFVWDGPGKKRPIPRSEAWTARMEKLAHNYLLAELDYWPIAEETDPRRQARDYLAFANEYPDGLRTSYAYVSAMDDEKTLKDVTGAENVEANWSAWDPKNPDPPAALAHYYLDQKIKLDETLRLMNQAQALFDAVVPSGADPQSQTVYGKDIKARVFQEVTTTPSDRAKIAFLWGQVYFRLNDLPQARADLETAVKAMPDKPEVQFAVGEVREKMGDNSQALDAYLAAASAPYGSTPEAREAYERLFLSLKVGSRKAADQRLFARIQQEQKQAVADYVPVQLNQPAPSFSFQMFKGKIIDNGTVSCSLCMTAYL